MSNSISYTLTTLARHETVGYVLLQSCRGCRVPRLLNRASIEIGAISGDAAWVHRRPHDQGEARRGFLRQQHLPNVPQRQREALVRS